MERTRLVALALLLLAVVAGITGLLWRGDDATFEPGGTGTETQIPGGTAADASFEPGTGAAPADGERRAEPAARNAIPAKDVPAGHVRVRVVHKGSHEPAPGAEVLFAAKEPVRIETLPAAGQEELQFLRADRERWLRRFGESTRADQQGYALVPVRDDRLDLVARLDSLYGELSRPWYDDPQRRSDLIELEPDQILRVAVQDANHRPVAGVLVAVRGVRAPRGDEPSRGEWLQNLGRSGVDGLLEVRHVQRLAQQVRDPRVVAAEPGLDADGVAVDFATPPAEPVPLVLPAFGSLDVKVVDDQGQPVLRELRVSVALMIGQRRTGRSHNRTTSNGQATFPFVAVGTSLQVDAAGGEERTNVKVAGPAAAGASANATLVLAGRPWWRGRVLDDSSKPIVNRRLLVRCTGGRTPYQTELSTDAEGRFQFTLPKNALGQNYAAMTLRLMEGPARSEPQGLFARVVPGLVQAGERDFGDVPLATAPLLVSGRIVGDTDDALARVTISVAQPRRNERGRESWGAAREAVVMRLPEGRFEIRGECDGQRLALNVYSDRHLSLPRRELQVPAQDVEIRVERGAELLATVLSDLPRIGGRMTLHLLRTDAPAPGARQLQAELLEHDGERLVHRWQALAAGSYRFELRLASAPRPVLTLEDLVIVTGRKNEDARLAAIDLRGQLRTITLSFVEAGGKPARVDWGAVVVRDPDPQQDQAGVDVSSARATIVTAAPYVDVLAAVPGYALRAVDGVARDMEVTLERPVGLRLRLAAGSAPPAGGTIAVRFEWIEDQAPRVRMWGERVALTQIFGNGEEVMLMGDRVGSIDLSLPGRYRVTCMPVKGEQRGPALASSTREVVLPQPAGTVVELAFDAERLRDAFRALGLGEPDTKR